MKTNKIILLGLLSLTLLFSSCDKDEVVETPITTAEVVIGAINKFKPTTIIVTEGEHEYEYNNYTIKDECWLYIEEEDIIDSQTTPIITYRAWDLNKVYKYIFYSSRNCLKLTFK